MARLAAAQEPPSPGTTSQKALSTFDLSPTERSAIKQEGKRLVRAAQQHFFIVISSSCLVNTPYRLPLSPSQLRSTSRAACTRSGTVCTCISYPWQLSPGRLCVPCSLLLPDPLGLYCNFLFYILYCISWGCMVHFAGL